MDGHEGAAPSSHRAGNSTLMTIEEVVEYIRFHHSTIYRLVRQRVLMAVKVGKRWRVDRQTPMERLPGERN